MSASIEYLGQNPGNVLSKAYSKRKGQNSHLKLLNFNSIYMMSHITPKHMLDNQILLKL